MDSDTSSPVPDPRVENATKILRTMVMTHAVHATSEPRVGETYHTIKEFVNNTQRCPTRVLLERQTEGPNEGNTFLMDAIHLPFDKKYSYALQCSKAVRLLRKFVELVENAIPAGTISEEECADLFTATNARGKTLLHIAARHGSPEVYKSVSNYMRRLPALMSDQPRMAALFTAADKKGYTPLHRAVRSGNAALVDAALADAKKVLDAEAFKQLLLHRNNHQDNLLHLANSTTTGETGRITQTIETQIKEAFGEQGQATVDMLNAQTNEQRYTPAQTTQQPQFLSKVLKPAASSLITRL